MKKKLKANDAIYFLNKKTAKEGGPPILRFTNNQSCDSRSFIHLSSCTCPSGKQLPPLMQLCRYRYYSELSCPVLSVHCSPGVVWSGVVWSGLVWPESDQNLSEYNHCSPTWLTMSGPVSPHLLVNQTHHPYNTPDTHCIAHIQGKQIKGFIFHDF